MFFALYQGYADKSTCGKAGRRFSPGLLRLPDTRFAEAFTEFLLNCRHGNITMSHGHNGVKEQIRHLVYDFFRCSVFTASTTSPASSTTFFRMRSGPSFIKEDT